MDKSDVMQRSHFLAALYMGYFMLLLAAGTMGYKLVSLGPLFMAPGSGLVFTFTFFLGSVITEIYGYAVMRRLIWLCVMYGTLFVLLICLMSTLPSPQFWHADIAYGQIIFHIFHFCIAGGLGFLISAFINAYLISVTKIKFNGTYFWLRSFVAAAISEIVANVVSVFITFFGAWNFDHTLVVLGTAYLYKLGYSVIGALVASLLVIWLRKKENHHVFDSKTKFNPFKMSL